MIRLVNIDSLPPTSLAWKDVLKLEIWEPKDVVLWYLTQNNITRIDDTRKDHEKTYELVRYGRWKRIKAYPNIIFCDECGEPFEKSNSNDKWSYCPNCGIRMMEEE